MDIVKKIATDLNIQVSQLEAAIRLLDAGDTVPFIARYRKEVTSGLSDIQLRHIEEKLIQLRELETRRQSILDSLKKQSQLTKSLESAILAAETKARLEDLYLPYRPRRKSKAQDAKDAGLAPLAELLLKHPEKDPLTEAKNYLSPDKGIPSAQEALNGARQILMELFSEEADLIQTLRHYLWDSGILISQARTQTQDKKTADVQKYKDYFKYKEPIHKVPSHRALALFRGRREEALTLSIQLNDDTYGTQTVMTHFMLANQQRPGDQWLEETAAMAWKAKIRSKLELEAFSRLKELAEEEAIKVFSRNLRALLLASPAGEKVIMGLDPGIRSGVKVVVVEKTGKVLDTTVVYPFGPGSAKEDALIELAKLIIRYQVELVSIGNGTASRETEQLVAEVLKRYPDLSFSRVIVSEAGASVYSASPIAAEEFPDLDVTLRGAISIARRLQDPLAELVKIDPKAIGVGQYQHDVNQSRLSRSLEAIVQDCVNAVGVDINTASVPLLAKVAGLNESVAKQIVSYRDAQGKFQNREQLKSVPRLGPKAFEQAAGFLRIKHGDNPLDASGVHPEAYPVVERIFKDNQWSIEEVMGNGALLKTIPLANYIDEHYGLPTLQDVIAELEKPGRDPRPHFKVVQFKPGIEQISDLQVGMLLDGVVSNVTNFGAFVDIGVHQDGLVHVSALAKRFVSDPHSVLKPGDVVTVKVIEVDVERRRIGLSMKEVGGENETGTTSQEGKASTPHKRYSSTAEAPRRTPSSSPSAGTRRQGREQDPRRGQNKEERVATSKPQKGPINTIMADALAKWKEKQHD